MHLKNRNAWCYIKQGILLVLLWAAFSFVPAHAQEAPPADDVNGEVTVELLAEALADDSVRDQLVEHLRAISHGESVVIVDEDGTQTPLAHDGTKESAGGKFVQRLQAFAQGLRKDIGHSWHIILSLFKGDDSQVERIKSWHQAVLSLILTIVVTVIAFRILRSVVMPIFRAFAQWATKLPSAAKLASQQRALERRFLQRRRRATQLRQKQEEAAETESAGEFSHIQDDTDSATETADSDLSRLDPDQAKKNYVERYTKLRKMAAVVGAFVVDVLAIMVAALVGYVVTTAAFAHEHQLTLFSMQFLTAFFAVEVVKAISRLFFAERFEALRLIPIAEQRARYWHGWFANVVNVGGYGLLVLVPFLQAVLAPAVANVFGSVLMLVVYFYAIGVLWRQRQQVSDGFIAMAERSADAVGGSVWRVSARLWFVVAWVYFTVLLFTTLVDQQNALSFMAQASLQTLLTLVIGGALFLVVTSLSSHHLHLSERWNEYFPLLEERLNSYMPIAFQVIRLFLFAGIILSLLDAWQVMNFQEWLTHGQGLVVLQTLLRIVLVCAVAATAWIVLASFIEHRLAVSGSHMPSERERTLLMLFKNALVIIISGLTLLIVLSQLGIDIGPLIAGAGVIGLAVGFGAQKLVQDVITGIFIQLENGMNQNDVVEVAGLFGSVEKLTIRSVVIRTLDGGYHLVPFSSIDSVSNHTRDYGYTVGEYVVGHRESVDETMRYLAIAFDDLKHDPAVADSILEDITIQGVTEINQQGVKIRILIKTIPGMQWAVQRGYNRYVKMRFDEAGIEMPYPHSVLHFGRDKKGYASPIDVQMVEALAESKQQTPTGYPPAGQTPRAFPGDS
ncbi:MAG TPA: mechanosensitive ion channel domain-containing protein [Paenalcaligenes sp.]|nr:mechanosensitive ion channel domain-containing protein [Paenalcaligenes sp.]